MPYTPPVVNYYNTATASWLSMSGVQSVNIMRGRQRFQDPISQTSLTVEIIPTATTTFNVGQLIDVRDANTDGSNCYFQGQITDVQRSYSFPYNAVAGTTPADRITISATGATGNVGSTQIVNLNWLSGNLGGIIEPLLNGQNLETGAAYPNSFEASGQIGVTGGLLEILNQLLNTGQLVFDDYKIARSIGKLGFTYYPIGKVFSSISFTDTGTGYAYTGLEYLSSVQNTFNWVEVEAAGVSTSITSGRAPFNALQYKTYSFNAADTANLSAYLYNLLSGQIAPTPFSISTDTMAADGCMALAQIPQGSLTNAVIGQPVTVAFRGTTGIGNVIGVNSVFYPDYGSVQCYLSPSFGPSFILDSASFGVLDQNRLGL